MKKPINQLQRIGLVANSEKLGCRELVRMAARLIRASGREVLFDPQAAALGGFDSPSARSTGRLAAMADLLIVFGGDGTMLRVARESSAGRTPIFGVNVGGLGFMTGASSTELRSALEAIFQGAFRLERRALIEAVCDSDGGRFHGLALNDFVISRGAIPRLIELDVVVDGENLTRYRCDGLIVCTPTGSTAYSLAAGGAIVSPNAEVITLTPICPHTLSNRSVIVSGRSEIEVRVRRERPETILSADGQMQTTLAAGARVLIRHSRRAVRLVRLEGASFFDTLRRKLRWSGSTVDQRRPARG